MGLLITSTPVEQGLLVSVDGEVDISNAPELRKALDEALAHLADGATMTIDISAVPYIDSTGIGVLVGTVHRAENKDVQVKLAHPQRNVARVLDMLGMVDELGIVSE